MTELHVRREGRAGRITLNRPGALNALTHEMALGIRAALDEWRDDDDLDLLLIDGAEGRAFCAGGDLMAMYATKQTGDPGPGRRFWRDEYAMNAALFHFPKPVATFLHGFTMGGGVGVGCHGSHRIVRDDSRIAMPECGIGLVPDVGGSLILARAPGRLGEFLAITGHRMGPGDAIHAGFADLYVSNGWDDLKAALCETGDPAAIDRAASDPPASELSGWRRDIDRLLAGERLADIARGLEGADGPAADAVRSALDTHSPLSMACAVEMLHRLGDDPTMERSLGMEYRFTHRALLDSDFIEGIRAQIVDKDRAPRWMHGGPLDVTPLEVSRMLMPLGDDALRLDEEGTP